MGSSLGSLDGWLFPYWLLKGFEEQLFVKTRDLFVGGDGEEFISEIDDECVLDDVIRDVASTRQTCLQIQFEEPRELYIIVPMQPRLATSPISPATSSIFGLLFAVLQLHDRGVLAIDEAQLALPEPTRHAGRGRAPRRVLRNGTQLRHAPRGFQWANTRRGVLRLGRPCRRSTCPAPS